MTPVPAIATRLGPQGPRSRQASPRFEHLRLKDRIKPGVRVLFVGINPGVRSALTGHHFAGFSNRFWKLLAESGLVPEPIGFEADHRLTEFGFGITNLIARPEHAETVANLQKELARWIAAADGLPDKMPLDEGIKSALPAASIR